MEDLTYSMEQSPSWKVNKFSASQEIHRILWNRRFITTFTRSFHLSLFWARSIQSMLPHPTSWRSILILPFHLRLGLTSGLFPSDFPTKTLSTPLLFTKRTTCPTFLILLDLITRIKFGEEYRLVGSSLCSFFALPCYIVPRSPIYSP